MNHATLQDKKETAKKYPSREAKQDAIKKCRRSSISDDESDFEEDTIPADKKYSTKDKRSSGRDKSSSGRDKSSSGRDKSSSGREKSSKESNKRKSSDDEFEPSPSLNISSTSRKSAGNQLGNNKLDFVKIS